MQCDSRFAAWVGATPGAVVTVHFDTRLRHKTKTKNRKVTNRPAHYCGLFLQQLLTAIKIHFTRVLTESLVALFEMYDPLFFADAPGTDEIQTDQHAIASNSVAW